MYFASRVTSVLFKTKIRSLSQIFIIVLTQGLFLSLFVINDNNMFLTILIEKMGANFAFLAYCIILLIHFILIDILSMIHYSTNKISTRLHRCEMFASVVAGILLMALMVVNNASF